MHLPRSVGDSAVTEPARLVAATAVLVVLLFPVYWMVISGLKRGQAALFHEPPYLYPPHPDWNEWVDVVREYGKPLLNSLAISGIAVCVTAAVCVPGAYALAKLGVGRRVNYILLLTLLIVQALPTIMLVAPLFEAAARLKLTNHYYTIGLFDSMYGVPFAVLILRAYMLKLPEELREAALVERSDGAPGVSSGHAAEQQARYRYDPPVCVPICMGRLYLRADVYQRY